MNLPTILVLSAIAVLYLTVILLRIRAKRRGKHGCSCGCGGCAMRELCHKEADTEKDK